MNCSNDRNLLINIKSKYILKQIFDNLKLNKTLNIIRNNKYLLDKLEKDINDYQKYLQIEIEIEIKENESCEFINIKEEYESFYHFYLDGNAEEIKLENIPKDKKVKNIKIVIDYEVETLAELFLDCKNITKINFVKYNRKDITDLEGIFDHCESLEVLNISQLKTDNVDNMKFMFFNCKLLKE